MMAQFNKGEDYIRQLSKQSTENARRLAQNLDAPNPYPAPPSQSRHQSPARGANNAGEEYIQQLARNSSDLARRRSKAFAEARRQQSIQGNFTEQTLETNIHPTSTGDTARDRAIAEIDKLNKEAEELQKLVERQQKLAHESEKDELPDELENITPQQIEQDIAAIEARLASFEKPPANLLNEQFAETEAKFAERQKSKVEPHIAAYEELRKKLDRSVSEDEDGYVTRFVEDEQPSETEEDNEPTDMDELSRLRRGMVELRLENERYARDCHELQQKHEQMMNIIIENYMPGL